MSVESSSHSEAVKIDTIRQAVADLLPRYRSALEDLARIESVSWPSFDQTQVQRSAEFVFAAATALGIFDGGVAVVRANVGDSDELGQPAVIARREPKDGAPTVLLYAHHDVQPPGDASSWDTPAFVPTQKGDRLYGRGVADDKAGVISHLAAIEALFTVDPETPLGLVLFVEGEEEYGSPSFGNLLAGQRSRLEADVIIVADSGNWTTEIPALTVSLRGNATLKVTVRTLDHALHSGMFGGVVPDAMIPLVRILGRLHKEDGSVAVPGLASSSGPVPEYTEETLREESGLLDGVSAVGHGEFLDRIWNQPSITVIGLDAPATSASSNTLLPEASAMVSLRVAPGQDAQAAAGVLAEFLVQNPPLGAQVEVEIVGSGSAFKMESTHEVVGRIKSSMKAAWDVEPVDIGVGGSIPFIADFVEEFPGAVVLVTGIEDPDTRAHSPNESLHLPTFEKAIITQAHFLAGMGAASAHPAG